MLEKSYSSFLTPDYKNQSLSSPLVNNHKSMTNFSSLTDSTNRDSLTDLRKRTMLETDFPTFKRSQSTKRYHISSKLIDGIKEEMNEDDTSSRYSCYSFRKKIFSPITIMPKDEILLFDAKPKQEMSSLLIKEIMEPVPEIEDDNAKKDDLYLKSPRIKIQSDNKEDATIPLKPLTVRSAPVNETDIIKEEKENQNGYEIVRSKYEHFIDKEEPPAKDIRDVQGYCFNYEDTIKEENNEEEQQTEMKAFILKKTSSFKKIKKVCADEVDEEKIGKIPTILAKIAMDEIINESDEFNN